MGLPATIFWQEGKTLHPYIAFGVEAGFPMKAVVLSKGENVGSLGNTQIFYIPTCGERIVRTFGNNCYRVSNPLDFAQILAQQS